MSCVKVPKLAMLIWSPLYNKLKRSVPMDGYVS